MKIVAESMRAYDRLPHKRQRELFQAYAEELAASPPWALVFFAFLGGGVLGAVGLLLWLWVGG